MRRQSGDTCGLANLCERKDNLPVAARLVLRDSWKECGRSQEWGKGDGERGAREMRRLGGMKERNTVEVVK